MKNNKGSVLVFFLLLAIPLILLLLTSVSLTRLMAARDEGRSALRIAVDGVMSEYDKNLYTEFGLLGVSETKFDVGEYLFQQNLNPTDASGAPLTKSVMSGNLSITAEGDKNLGDMDRLLKQIKEFEKYMNLEEADDAGEVDDLYFLNQNLHERAVNLEALTRIRKKINHLEIPDAMEQFVSGYSFSTASLTEDNEKEEFFREIKDNESSDGENMIFSGKELSGSEMLQKMSEEIMTLSTEILMPESISDAESENHRSVMNYIQMMFSSEHNRKSDDALRNECEQEFSYMLWNHYDNLRIEKRDLTEGELPTVVSKMLLLIHSGMTLNDAWNLVAREGHGVIYDEMKITYREIKMEGVPEKKAYEGFAERCGSVKITSFVSMITQNLQKGSADLVKYMEEMLQEIWQNKEALIQRKVTRVSDLLMYPSLLIFVGILMMILIPIFMQFSTLL